ncbi:hypothetical protein ES708_16599 [subsurface metagenome]
MNLNIVVSVDGELNQKSQRRTNKLDKIEEMGLLLDLKKSIARIQFDKLDIPYLFQLRRYVDWKIEELKHE